MRKPISRSLVWRLGVMSALLLCLASMVEIPFYVHGIYEVDWSSLLGSQVDWKSFPPFSGSLGPALQAVEWWAFVLLPLVAVLLLATALWGIRSSTGHEFRLRAWAILFVVLMLLPWVLHDRRLPVWYLD
jgi:hypothetical protein